MDEAVAQALRQLRNDQTRHAEGQNSELAAK